MLAERNKSSDPSKISRIGVSRATLKPSWNCANESVSALACLVFNTDIKQLVRTCENCQTSYGQAPITSCNSWIRPHRPWQRVHVYYCSPLQCGSFLAVKWFEVLRMSSTTGRILLASVYYKNLDSLAWLFTKTRYPEVKNL